jgi:hypothetical protein
MISIFIIQSADLLIFQRGGKRKEKRGRGLPA